MHWYETSLGKKYLMALTGLIMVLYVVAHLLGNFSIFAGPNAINSYAVNLRRLGPLLWLFRLILLMAAVLHVWFAIRLNLENRRARPTPYLQRHDIRTSFAAETMIWSGLIIAAFIVYHILHFTLRVTNPEISNFLDTEGRHNVYAMVLLSFRLPAIVAVYVAAMIVLLLHLYHGIQSLFQSMGWNSGHTQPKVEGGGRWVAVALGVGFAFIPLALLFRLISL